MSLKIFVTSLYIFTSFLSFANAEESKVLETGSQIIADVSLKKCAISQSASTTQTIYFSCEIFNNLLNQGDINFAVQLIKKENKEIVDTLIYEKSFSMSEKQTIKYANTYHAPEYLDGNYELWGILKTSEGTPLSFNLLGNLNLKSKSNLFLKIIGDTCYLKIKGEKESYNLAQGIDVEYSDEVEAFCDVESHLTNNLKLKPVFITHKRSIFGEIVSTISGLPVDFNKKDKKTLSFLLEKPKEPQSYETILYFVNGDGIAASNKINLRYVVKGASATIQQVLLDKSFYLKNDTARVSVFWTGSADSFTDARKSLTEDNASKFLISIKNKENANCSKDAYFDISNNKKERTKMIDYHIKINMLCVDPIVDIKIFDNKNSLLAEKKLSIKSAASENELIKLETETKVTPSFEDTKDNKILLGFLAIILAVITLIFIVIRNKNYEK